MPPFLMPKTGTTRADRWLLLQWRLGAVTRHETCHNCGGTLTRSHAADCSGATDLLTSLHPEVPPPAHSRHTLIDAVLNQYRQQASQDGPAHSNCAKAIQLILQKCRGLRQRQQDGRWVSEDSEDAELATPQDINTAPPARTVRAIRQTARNAATSVARNRTVGRPRKRRADELDGGMLDAGTGMNPKRHNDGDGRVDGEDEGVG